MGKKFVGLGGLKHFWTKAKTWIAGQITAEVTAKIAEIVANAPEDLDTLKEIADWISTHANDASTMNTQINTNKNDIAALQTSVAGKSDTGHTHTKSQITDFAHTHDDMYFTKTEVTSKLAGKSDTGHKHSASDITSGVLPVANGGTGVTTQANINKAFIGNLAEGTSDITDGTEFVSSYASNNGFSAPEAVNDPFRRKFSTVWNYIKDKISSVLGLTKDNYGGKASTAGTADKATSDVNGNSIADTYATKTALNNKANVANTNYKTTKVFYGNRNGRYVKIGSIPVSSGTVGYAALSIDVFSVSPVANFPVGSIILNMSSGNSTTAFNINGYSSISLNDLTNNYPHIVVEKTSTDYNLYVDSAYSYMSIAVTEGLCTKYTRGNFEEVSTLSGTVVYDSVVDNQIILVNGTANKIVPKYTSVTLTKVTSHTDKYIKLADCLSSQAGTLQVRFIGDSLDDTLVINFGGGNALHPMLCGHYSGNSGNVLSVIAQKGSAWNSSYSVYVKVNQVTDFTVHVALLKGDCTINISESTIAPTNISEWNVSDGLFGTLTGNSSTATSVVDYGDTSKTIKIGYTGAGLTASELGYIAGYKSDGDGTGVQIKDISKDVLQSWLGLSNYLPLSGGTVTGKLDVKTAGIRIPTSQPSSLADGDIWVG